jgi:hypothetical protein
MRCNSWKQKIITQKNICQKLRESAFVRKICYFVVVDEQIVVLFLFGACKSQINNFGSFTRDWFHVSHASRVKAL